MAYHIDELKPGMSESLTRQVSERDIDLFGEATGDLNPVHFDEAFAKSTLFKGRIAHGALTVSYISAVLGMKLPGPGTIVFGVTAQFKAPVRIGDTVTAICTVREVLDKRRVAIDCLCRVGDRVVLEGDAIVMPPPRPR
jgi:3-hydroxybutyryl-CoA dehydratase